MSQTLINLLAIDAKSAKFGCALKPELRAALEADLRFPARAASPLPSEDDMQGPLPDNVNRLADARQKTKRKTA
jgi:hypothetical protein